MAYQPLTQRSLTRRHFVYLTGLAATGVVATACGGGDEPLSGQTPRPSLAHRGRQPGPQARHLRARAAGADDVGVRVATEP